MTRRVSPLYLALVCLLGCDCYHLSEWHGEVEVTAVERAAIAKCGVGSLTEEGTAQISRRPYLQSTTTTSTTVVWGSKSGSGEVILRDPKGDVVAQAVSAYAGDPERRKRRLEAQSGSLQALNADDIYLVSAEVSGLEPRHLYCYQLFSEGVALTEPAPLITAAPPGTDKPIRFVALGDTGTGGAAQAAIAKRISAEEFDFMLFLGDVAYESGSPAQIQSKFFEVYRQYLRFVPSFPTIGNHERRTRNGGPYLEAFVLPSPERYYSFDWGDVHFVAFDTTRRDTKQLKWLEKDLKDNKLPWVIAFGHHPLYSNSLRGPQISVRRAFATIFTRAKVDLVLTGHEHHYERFRVLGINYVVSGGGGGRLTRIFGRTLALKQRAAHHYLSFEVGKTDLVMRAIDIQGREIEKLHLEKPSDDPDAPAAPKDDPAQSDPEDDL